MTKTLSLKVDADNEKLAAYLTTEQKTFRARTLDIGEIVNVAEMASKRLTDLLLPKRIG